jgi:regulator of protease activity HflC (stomatin/prohibitin superfamily)
MDERKGRMSEAEQDLKFKRKLITIGGTLGFVILFIVSLFIFGCDSISPGNVGIQVSRVGSSRGVQDVTIKTGWVVYNRLFTQIIEYPVYMQTVKWTKSKDEGKEADESLTFTTQDSMVINADVSLSYQLNYDNAPQFYVKFRADDITSFTDGFMRNVARDSFNEVAGKYSVEQIMGDNGPILMAVRQKMKEQLGQYGIAIDQLGFIGAPRPPEAVTQSINMKVQAQQIALQKQNEVAQAEADARKQVAAAEGDAKSLMISAQADHDANILRSSTVTPQILQLKAIEAWDGKLPQVTSGSTPFVNLKE